MEIEMGDIACSTGNTEFQIIAGGRKYRFILPNELIFPYIEEDQKIDCPQFVIESQEIFEELAEEIISRGGEGPFIIDRDLLTTYFQ